MKRFNGITLGVAFCSLASQAALAQTKIDTLKVQHLNEVIVKGVRATKEAPYAIANIKKSELQQFSRTGKELPFLLSRTPGILAWGENGIGTGTTYMPTAMVLSAAASLWLQLLLRSLLWQK